MNSENETNAINLVALAKQKRKEEIRQRRTESWGGKQLRRFKWRTYIQFAMMLLCIYLGFQFYFFVQAVKNPVVSGVDVQHTGRDKIVASARPAGVDGFLPITGMMGAVDWFSTGKLNTIHPSATILFLTFILISLVWRKAFCSWFCPVGTISEYLALLGRKVFGRNFRLWNWLDVILRVLKYVLLSFFVGSIFMMGLAGTHDFLYSDYNHVVDIKMGMFFLQLGVVGLSVFAFLIFGSVFVNGLWCRYLCPYGALLGLFSWLSPTKVVRSAPDCINCGFCDKACPARLPVMSKPKIVSVECTGCFDCVASCPVPAALNANRIAIVPRRESKALPGKETLDDIFRNKPVRIKNIAIAVCTVFVGVWLLAQAFGLWHNSITEEQYRTLIPKMDTFAHPGR